MLYEYQRPRNASHPREFLKGFSGVYVTDGYQVYHTIEGERKDLKIAGCWSHARRRFNEAVKALPKAKQQDSQLNVRPLVEAYFVWVRESLPKVPQKSKTWEAFNYSPNQENT